MAFNQDVGALVPREFVSSLYLAYWFAANASEMLRLATEATHGTKRIAEVLESHDACIRAERRIGTSC